MCEAVCAFALKGRDESRTSQSKNHNESFPKDNLLLAHVDVVIRESSFGLDKALGESARRKRAEDRTIRQNHPS